MTKENTRFTPLLVEALAYHEAGHAVMAVLLKVPILKTVIGPAAAGLGCDGEVIIDFVGLIDPQVPPFKSALISVASEPAERLAPSFDEFKAQHENYQNYGVCHDISVGFLAVRHIYHNLSKPKALNRFQAEYLELAVKCIEVAADAVHNLAKRLMETYEVRGSEIATIVQAARPPLNNKRHRDWRLHLHRCSPISLFRLRCVR